MSNRVARFVFVAVVLLVGASGLMAQLAPTGSLTGTVLDPQGAAIVGADVKVVDDATGREYPTKSGSDGRFAIGNLPPSTYTVAVTMQGFRKGVFKGVKVVIGEVYDLAAHLELGEVASTVVVEAGQEVIETTTATVGTSITGKAITQLPFTSRDALDLAVLVPGAQTTGRPRQTSFEGLPKGAINITFDGINAQDTTLKSNDGFFTLIRPRVDDVEEFGITTAVQSADLGAAGAVQIRFSSKRGGSTYHGGVWEYLRNDWFNANYWFNNATGQPRQVFRLHEYGYKVGGPILKDKLFFFTDFDFYRNPQSQFKQRTILTPSAAAGQFTYSVSSIPSSTPSWVSCNSAALTCTATLMGASGFAANVPGGPFTSTVDSVVGGLLTAMNNAASASGVQPGTSTGNAFTQNLTFNNSGTGSRKFPDLRLDWNITKNHSFEFGYHYSHFTATPDFLNGFDQTFPVAPFNTNQGSQISNRNLFVGAWRWNIGTNKSNEVRMGIRSSPVAFFPDLNPSVYPQFSTNLGTIRVRPVLNLVSQPLLGWSVQGRNDALGQLVEGFTWTKGTHSMSFGMGWTEFRFNDFSGDEAVAEVGLGVDSTDPIQPLFNTTNFPGISTTDLGNIQALYGMLAGRITQYGGFNATTLNTTGNVYLNASTRKFQTGHNLIDEVNSREFGFYGSDTWRVRPSLTLTYGLRWEFVGIPVDQLNEYFRPQGGFAGVFGASGLNNLFNPGSLKGTTTVFELNNGRPWRNNDFRDFAPNIGVAWQPGSWHRIFGGPGKTVFRAGYSITYSFEGGNNFASIAGSNPGFSGAQFATPVTSVTCTPQPCGQFVAGSLQLQSKSIQVLGQSPASFVTSFPIDPTAAQSVNMFAPDLKTPRVQSWSVGIQREITPSMVLEVRYVGNHGTGLWRQINVDEVNIFENGFLTEFLNANSNLAICQANPTNCKNAQTAAGVSSNNLTANNFADWGLSGQVPLPIMTAAFTGSSNASASASTQRNANFRSGTRISNLNNGAAGSFATALSGSLSFWNNIQAAGLPKNFWIVNPDARGGAFAMTNGSQSTYNALQIEFRRRPSKGLQFNANYTFSKSLTNYFANSSVNFQNFDTLRDTGRNKGLAPFDLRHAFKMQLIYELPFGPGHKWSTGVGFINRLIEGWEFNAINRWQSGRITQLVGTSGAITGASGFGTFNNFDGGVALTGLTQNQLQSLLGIRETTISGSPVVFYFPDSLMDSTQTTSNRAFVAPCTTPGKFCPRVFVTGPRFFRADWSMSKTTKITERVNFQIRAELLNAFNNINFLYGGNEAATPTSRSITSTTTPFGRIANAYQDISTTDDPGGRIIQLVFRISF